MRPGRFGALYQVCAFLQCHGFIGFFGGAGIGIQWVGFMMVYGHHAPPSKSSQNPASMMYLDCASDHDARMTVPTIGAVSIGCHSLTL
jgi:hypothetical protein